MSERFTWEQRIERAEFLKSQHESASELLAFETELLQFQKSVYDDFARSGKAEIALLGARAPELLSLVEHCAPPEMAAMADGLRDKDWSRLLHNHWTERASWVRPTDDSHDFFVRALLQPFAESLASNHSESQGERCPSCGSLPQLAVMRPEGNGAKRSLLCGLCGTEWSYRRLKCVHCGEEDKDRLPTFKSELYTQIALAACDTCKTYLKCVDLSVDGHAVPSEDDIASVAVSLWAIQKQYHPVVTNLFGF